MPSTDSEHLFSIPQIEDKLRFLQECIQQVEAQLRERVAQWKRFEVEIQGQALELSNRILHLEQIGDMRVPINPRRRSTLETEIKKLEKERREQELEYWRDSSQLQRELRQLKKEYRAVKVGYVQAG